MSYGRTILHVAAVAVLLASPTAGLADTGVFTITNDSSLDAAVAAARSDFLAAHPYATRLDATLLLPNPDGTWRRGSYNPTAIAYPASCVKLAYMAAAMYWERTNGYPVNYLDQYVRPMIEVSDNVATGYVVDAITGAPNYSTSTTDATFWAWYAKRQYTENYLAARGLLENQIIFNKTYPSNSGSSVTGAELLGLNNRGGNRMQPKCAASLMLEIIKGAIEPQATSYMRGLLTHARFSDGSELGFGLPPGAIYENKPGLAYDTLEDIAYVMLPNGQEFILAAFSNGYTSSEPSNPTPYDGSFLGNFTELLIDRLNLAAGCPPKIKIDNTSAAVSTTGTWNVVTDQSVDYDMYGASYLSCTSTAGTATASITWTLNPPSAGLYEVCVWSPQKTTGTTVTYRVNHASGTSPVTVDQRHFGGRWYRLGDFNFNAGQGTVVLNNQTASAGKYIMADAVKITRWPSAPVITAASSHKTHGSAGTFAIDVTAGATECRGGGPTTLVVSFDQPIQRVSGLLSDVTVSHGTVNALTINGNQLTINMTGATSAAKLTVGFSGIKNPSGQVSTATLCLGVLSGDSNADRKVDVLDLVAIRNNLNLSPTVANFRSDINADGSADIFDLVSVRNNFNAAVSVCP